MSGPWQVVPDETEDADPRTSWAVDLRRVCGGVVVVLLVIATLTPLMLDQSIVFLPAYAALSACGRSLAGASSPSLRGVSVPAGSMKVPRVGHTATLLPSGKVLVAGGQNLAAPVGTASAELYDPITGTWSLTGPMKSARAFHAAVLLQSGKVLVAGGLEAAGELLASAELYDPATGQWTETGGMPAGGFIEVGEAVVLRSGKVFVSLRGAALNSKPELYDPASGSWSAIGGSMVDPRAAHPGSGSTTVLGSGNVLVLDGGARAQLFDPVTGAWKLAGNMITIREWQTATLLPSGKVLVAGGYESSFMDAMSKAEIYDPVTDVWSLTSSMPAPTLGARATLLPSGEVLVAGGGGPGPEPNPSRPRASINLYEPATGSWTALRAMAAPRSFFTATLLHSGALLFVGGAGTAFAADGPYASAELYALRCPSR